MIKDTSGIYILADREGSFKVNGLSFTGGVPGEIMGRKLYLA